MLRAQSESALLLLLLASTGCREGIGLTDLGMAICHKANIRDHVPVKRHIGVDVAIPSQVKIARKTVRSVRTMCCRFDVGCMPLRLQFRDLRPFPVNVNHAVLVGKLLLTNHSIGFALDDRVPKDNLVLGLRCISTRRRGKRESRSTVGFPKTTWCLHDIPYVCWSRVFSNDIDEQLLGIPIEQ